MPRMHYWLTLFQRHLQKTGVRGTLQTVVHRLRPRHEVDEFDRKYGTKTAGRIPLWRTTVKSANVTYGVGYGTASEAHVRALLEPLPKEITVVDLGSGMGRILIIAACLGFAKVIGVEFVGEWAQIAHENLRTVGKLATVICGDVTEFALPDGPLAVYLYNPFEAPVMAQVAAALQRHVGPLWVIYVNPRHAELFGWMDKAPLTAAQAALFSDHSVAVFHHASMK